MTDFITFLFNAICKYFKVIIFTLFFSWAPSLLVVVLAMIYEVFIPEHSGKLIIVTIIVVFYLAWKYIPNKYT